MTLRLAGDSVDDGRSRQWLRVMMNVVCVDIIIHMTAAALTGRVGQTAFRPTE